MNEPQRRTRAVAGVKRLRACVSRDAVPSNKLQCVECGGPNAVTGGSASGALRPMADDVAYG
jgi:hypothetical protein